MSEEHLNFLQSMISSQKSQQHLNAVHEIHGED